MPKYCSQCGKAGHNKRNRICQININRERYQVIVEEVEWVSNIDLKREILNTYMNEIRSELDSLIDSIDLERNTVNFYLQQVNDARKVHISAQHTGPMELCIESYNQLECAIAAWEIIYRNYINLFKIKDSLREIAMNLIVMWNTYCVPQHTNTSHYLKEMSVVLDLTSSEPLLDQTEKSVEKYECPLCYDVCEFKNVVQTNCGHNYCLDCMKNFATSIKDKTTEPACPLCRTSIKELKIRNGEILGEYIRHVSCL